MAGMEKVVLAGCQALRQIDVDVEIGVIRETRVPSYAETFVSEAKTRGVRVFTNLHATKRVDFNLYRELSVYFRNNQFDILHTHGNKVLLYGARAKRKTTKLVHTQHGDTAHSRTVRFYAWLGRMQLRFAHAIFAVSKEMQSQMLSGQYPANRVQLVENMLAMEPPYPLRSANRKIDQPHFIVVGRLSPEKGIDILLAALAELDQPRPQLTIVGDGPTRSQLESRVKELDLCDSVSFAGFHSDIKPLLAKADAFVMPSLREGFPMSLIEAAACGLPIIASRVGGIPNLVVDGENGLLCEPGSVELLHGNLRTFLEDQIRYISQAREMAVSIQERFSSMNWARRTLNVYQTLQSQQGPTVRS